VKAVQTIVGNLKSFGLNIEMQTVEVSNYWGSMFPSGEFRLCANGWGQGPYPYYSFNQLFGTSSAETAYNYPTEVELPPVGKPDASPSETFEPRALTQRLARTTDESKATDIVQQLAWTVNRDLVMAPIWDQYGHYFVAGDDWTIPPQDDSDTSTGLGVYWMMRQGDVAAKSN